MTGRFGPQVTSKAMGGGGASGASAAKTIVSKFNIEIEAFFKQLLTGARSATGDTTQCLRFPYVCTRLAHAH
jgi:hypothetical protein